MLCMYCVFKLSKWISGITQDMYFTPGPMDRVECRQCIYRGHSFDKDED